MNNRRNFREPIPEIFNVVRYLDAGVSAHLSGHTTVAEQLFRLANNLKVREWTESIWGSNSQYVKIIKQTSLHTKSKEKK